MGSGLVVVGSAGRALLESNELFLVDAGFLGLGLSFGGVGGRNPLSSASWLLAPLRPPVDDDSPASSTIGSVMPPLSFALSVLGLRIVPNVRSGTLSSLEPRVSVFKACVSAFLITELSVFGRW